MKFVLAALVSILALAACQKEELAQLPQNTKGEQGSDFKPLKIQPDKQHK